MNRVEHCNGHLKRGRDIPTHLLCSKNEKNNNDRKDTSQKRIDYGDCCNNNPQGARDQLSHRLWLRSLAGRQCHQGVGRHLQVFPPIMIFESFVLMITSLDMKIMTLRLMILLLHLRFTINEKSHNT